MVFWKTWPMTSSRNKTDDIVNTPFNFGYAGDVSKFTLRSGEIRRVNVEINMLHHLHIFCWNFKKSHRITVLRLEIRCFLIEIPMGPAVFVEKNADALESEDLDQLRSAEITGRILTTWHGEEYRKNMQGGDGWQVRRVLFEDSAGLILLWWNIVETEWNRNSS